MHYETVGTKIANMLPEKLLNLKFDNFNKRITQWLTIDFKKLRIITYNTIVQLYRVKKNKIDNKYDCCLLLKKIKVYFQRIFFFSFHLIVPYIVSIYFMFLYCFYFNILKYVIAKTLGGLP